MPTNIPPRTGAAVKTDRDPLFEILIGRGAKDNPVAQDLKALADQVAALTDRIDALERAANS